MTKSQIEEAIFQALDGLDEEAQLEALAAVKVVALDMLAAKTVGGADA